MYNVILFGIVTMNLPLQQIYPDKIENLSSFYKNTIFETAEKT
jgi:hypothetical protein